MKKHIKTLNLFFSLFLSGLIFFSCTNIFTPDSPEAKSSQNSTGKIKLQGSVAIPDDEEGATSSVLLNVLKRASLEQGEERSASYSELPAGYDFFAVATRASDGLVVGAAADECIWMGDLSAGTKSFAMNLDYGHWTVKAGIKKSGAALNPAEADIIYVSEEPIDLQEGAPLIYTKSFKPKPRQISSGSIGLNMTKTSGIDFVTATLISGDSAAWQSAGFGSDESDANISITSDIVTFSTANIKSGAYIVLFKYYDCDDFMGTYSGNAESALASRTPILVYSTIQTISVYDNLETNRWVKSVGDVSPITESGTFVLTDDILANYSLTNLHVSSTGSDSNSGSAYKPFATLSKAVSYIEKQGNSSVDYTITVSGECVGATEITSALNGKANSITIQGKNTPAAGSSPTDALVGDSGGTGASANSKPNVLNVATSVPLYVKNIKITKLSDRASRGIIINNSSAKVYLQNGTELSSLAPGNSGGGAVSVVSGKLYVEGAEIKGNEVGQEGGAIYIGSSGEVEISSGEISGNKSSNVGGAISNSGSLKITGGTIKDNITTASSFDYGGGAIYAAPGSTTGIGGNASIPYGVRNASDVLEYGCGKNDICLNRSTDSPPVQAKLTLTSNLSNHDSTSKQIGLKVNGWKRGTEIIEAEGFSLTSDVLNKFKTVDEDFRVNTKTISGSVKGVLTGDIVVAANDSATYNAATVRGTSSEPYKTIADALANAVDSDNTTITVSGTVSGAQTITSVPDGVTELLIKGKTTAAKIDAGGTSGAGSALTVDANGKTVTIQDLTITGGYTASNGGGINLEAGTVKLVGGAKITGNIAEQYGGGVYLGGSDSKLFMSGSSLIGDSATSTRLAEDGTSAGSTTFANKAVKSGGGIYNNGGSVYIGYSGITSGTPQKSDMTSGYGVRRNYAGSSSLTSTYGGGILNGSGTLHIASGSISYNQHYNNGGGIYIQNGEAVIEEPGSSSNIAKFEGNKAAVGGAIYIYNGKKLTMKAGQIGGSATSEQNVATSMGGAIYQGGTFNVSGSAYIAPGSETTNDVYLASGKTVAITGALTPPSGVTAVATITPDSYSRRRDILSSDSANKTYLLNAIGKFKLSQDDSGWDRDSNISVASETEKKVWITSSIYVVDAADSGNTRPSGFNKGKTSGANGTKTSPYASIAAAALASDLAEADGKITVAGTLTGVQTISSVVSGVSSVTLKGYDSNATINGNAAGSALTINAEKTFTIQQLKITNGRAAAGGGINITSGSGTIVNLDSGAKVYNNKVTSGGTGAGVCVASGATLNIKSGSEIYSNTAYSGTINGGGVYNGGTTTTSGGQIYNNSANNGGGVYNGGSLYVTGTSLIGDGTSNNNTATGTTPGSTCSNKADNYGGGIYNNGNLYFGCDSTGSSSTSGFALTTGYGVRRNYASSGGGVYLAGGTFKAASGTVSYNHATRGGAIYVSSGTGHVLGAVSLASNKVSSAGGALYLDSSTKLTVNGTAEFIVNSAEATSGSNHPCGGAVYNYGTLEITANATMKGNFSKVSGSGTGKAYGGAIANYGTLTMSSGTIGVSGVPNKVSNTVTGYTANAYGGAIYQGGTFNVSGTAYVYPGSEKTNDVYLASGKTVAINGDWSGSQASASKMTLTPASWTRGTTVVSKGTSFSSNLGSGIIGKFAPSDSEWSAILYGSGASAVGKIDADIWVAGSGTLTSCSKAGDDSTGNGTKAKPYASIATAVSQCWGGPKDTATGGRTIYVEGTVTAAANTEQTISSGITSAKATAIKLLGNGSGVTLKPASGKRVLSIYTAVPVTIQNLKISGGSTTDNGAGIYVSAAKASLTLTTGAVVTGANTTAASGKGGGIYIAGSSSTGNAANLIMNGTAQISGNSASGTSGAGGGVYLSYANLCMSGNALIGDTSGTTAATSGSTGHSNMAKNGGGVYCDTGSNVYLGFASASDSGTSLSKGIRRNYASSCGGGIYVNGGTVTLKTGYVSYNGTAATSDCDGGGIWQKSGTTVTISGGTIAKNKGYYGGGVYAGGTFTMSGGTIGDSSTSISTAATSGSYSNYAAYGGGIYAPSGASVSLNSGYVSYNYASEQGGGIKAIASITFKSNANYNGTAGNGGGLYANTFILSSGTIKGNEAAGNGGGIACAVNASYTLTISGGTVTANKALNGGGVYGGAIGMTGGTISSNTATNTAVTDEYCGGGGIFADTYYLVLTGGSIQGNISKGNGGGVLMRDSYLYMSGSAVIGNSGASAPPDATGKTNSNNADYDGGGIYANCDGAIYIGYTNSIPTNQTKAVAVSSMTGGVFYNYSGRDGGGICNWASNGVKIAKGNIKCNASPSGNGGGVCFTNDSSECFIYDGSVDGNKALNGGGVYLDGVSLTMSGGTVSANTATKNSTTNASKNGGGGVYLNDPTNGAKYFKMTAGTIAGNTSKQNGGGLLINGGKFYMSGTAVIGYAGAGTSTDASTCDDSNKADDCGGGIYAGAKSEVYIGYSDSSTLAPMSSYEASCIRCNYAKNYGGGLYTLNYNTTFFKFASGWIAFNRVGSSGYGAGIYHSGKATSYIGFSSNSYGPDIVANSSGNAREYFYGSTNSLSSQRGGGIYNVGVITFSKGNIRSNYAKEGGGVYNASGATFTMNGANAVIGSTETYFGDDNNAIDGAGVHNGGTFTISSGYINKNRSHKYGAGVYNWGGTFTISGGQINNNAANKYQATYDCEGGGIYISGGTVTVSGGSVSSNECGTDATSTTNCGGNIAFSNGTFSFEGGEVKGGYSKGYGNSIYAAKVFTMKGNAHTEYASGGEIYLASSACINIPANLTYKSSNTYSETTSIALITPASYTNYQSVQVLKGSYVSSNNKKFNVSSNAGYEYVVASTGYLRGSFDN